MKVHWRKDHKAIRLDKLPKSEFWGGETLFLVSMFYGNRGELNINDSQETEHKAHLR